MKYLKIITFAVCISAPSVAISAPPSGYCDVIICNKLQRISFNPWSHIKDKLGEQCFPQLIPIDYAIPGSTLHSGTRFYQGSFNPTKRSSTKVKKVLQCTKEQHNAE